MNRRQFLKMSLSTAIAGGAGWAIGDTTNSLRVERRELFLPNWEHDGLKVAVLSDIHAVSMAAVRRVERAFALAAQEKPDLVVMPGDFVTHYLFDPALVELALSYRALVDCPVLASLGNHDVLSLQADSIGRSIRKSNIELLVNEVTDVRGVNIWGVDSWKGQPDYSFASTRPKNTLMLLHEPDPADLVPGQVSLIISGHTHGGQVCMPGGIAMFAPAGGRKYITGIYGHNASPLYVTRGVGSLFNKRFFCYPEVSILTLRAAA